MSYAMTLTQEQVEELLDLFSKRDELNIEIRNVIAGASLYAPKVKHSPKTSKNAWRDEPVSEKQLGYIKHLGGNTTGIATKGQASELIESLKKEGK